MQSSSSTSSNARSFLMVVVAVLVVFEITSTFVAAYPARYYSGYYSPIGLEEQNPNYMNLQQAIARLRQAFIDNNDLENANNINQGITELLQLTRVAFDNWFKRYQDEIGFIFNPNFKERKLSTLPKVILEDEANHHLNQKRSEIAQVQRSQINRFTLDGSQKRIADFGTLRGHTGEKEYGLRYWNHLG